MADLSAYKRKIVSQWGEDGIIAEIFKRIGEGSRRVVEFGAWDGKHLSNAWALWHESEWFALLIESNRERAAALARSTTSTERVTVLHRTVAAQGPDRMDAILRDTNFGTPDLMSIDIDGDDYYILESLHEFLPRVIVIEFNPTFPATVTFVQRPGLYIGSSAAAIVELGKKKGYRLAAVTETNVILVNEREWPKLGIADVSLDQALPTGKLTYLVSGYDGTLFSIGKPAYSGASRATRYAKAAIGSITSVPLYHIPVPFNRTVAAAIETIRNRIQRLWHFHRT